MFGFDVSLGSLIDDMLNAGMPINIYAGYLLLSLPLFLIFAIMHIVYSSHKYRNSLFDTVAIDFQTLVWAPHRGITVFSEVTKFGKMDAWEIKLDLKVMFINLLETVIWWGSIILAVYYASKNSQCALMSAMAKMEKKRVLIATGLMIAVIVLLNFIGWLLFKIASKRWRAEDTRTVSKGTRGQRYYERHPERVPSGCSACGGPYPECKSSCSMFNE